jgi:hypothetical protein
VTLFDEDVTYPRRVRIRGISLAYPFVVGAVISALLVAPIGIGGQGQVGAWLYVALVIAVVTFAFDRLLRIPFGRWAPPHAFVWIPFAATAVGILAGWWALNNTMGGPV